MNKDKGPKKSIYYYYMLALAIFAFAEYGNYTDVFQPQGAGNFVQQLFEDGGRRQGRQGRNYQQ